MSLLQVVVEAVVDLTGWPRKSVCSLNKSDQVHVIDAVHDTVMGQQVPLCALIQVHGAYSICGI